MNWNFTLKFKKKGIISLLVYFCLYIHFISQVMLLKIHILTLNAGNKKQKIQRLLTKDIDFLTESKISILYLEVCMKVPVLCYNLINLLTFIIIKKENVWHKLHFPQERFKNPSKANKWRCQCDDNWIFSLKILNECFRICISSLFDKYIKTVSRSNLQFSYLSCT